LRGLSTDLNALDLEAKTELIYSLFRISDDDKRPRPTVVMGPGSDGGTSIIVLPPNGRDGDGRDYRAEIARKLDRIVERRQAHASDIAVGQSTGNQDVNNGSDHQ
jgi:hypothetical protein